MKENEGLKFEMEVNGKIPPFLFLSTKRRQGENGGKASDLEMDFLRRTHIRCLLRKNEHIGAKISSRGKRMNFKAREGGAVIYKKQISSERKR